MILSLYVTLDCNHRCRYCYAAPARKAEMSQATAEQAVLLAAAHCRQLGDASLGIRFFGGEPLLRWDLIPPVVALARRPEVSGGLDLSLGIATNGTLLSPRRCDFLREHDFGVGISMDGPAEVHDQNRVFSGGAPTWRHVRRKLRLATERGLRVSLALVADPTAIERLPDSLRYLREETGCAFFTVSFDIHAAWSEGDLARLDEAFRGLANWYVECFRAGRPVQVDFLNNKINVLLRGGFRRESICSIGASDLAATPDGLLFPCLRLAAMDPDGATAIGSVAGGLDDTRVRALRAKSDGRFSGAVRPPRCGACAHPESCLSWCAATNLAMTGDPSLVGEVMCRHERATVVAASSVLERIDRAAYERLYAEDLDPPLPEVVLPAGLRGVRLPVVGAHA